MADEGIGHGLPEGRMMPVDAVDVRLAPSAHPIERGNAEAIAENWRREIAARPALFDGEMVLLSRLSWRDRVLSDVCHKVRYSTFLFWRATRAGTAAHCFAHAMPVSSDGALVAIRMGGHTINGGKVYFAAGSFEPEDFFADGQVDVLGNMAREVGEETGIDLTGLPRDAGYQAVSMREGTVVVRRFFLPWTAEDIAGRIARFVAAEAEPEISGPVVIRSADDLPEGLMPHMKPLVAWHFAEGG
jgi:8-oxo-dGTP pyrophosphatase MutT (NUDIX family)